MERDPFQKYVEVALVALGTFQAGYGGWQSDYVIMLLGSAFAVAGGALLGARFDVGDR